MTQLKMFLDLVDQEDYNEAVRRTNTVIKNLQMAEEYELKDRYLLVKLNNLWIAYRFYYMATSIFYFEQITAPSPDSEVMA